MAYKDNLWLEKYEYKKPDYDLISRGLAGKRPVFHKPARYVKKGGQWVPRSLKARFLKAKTAKIMFVGDITCFARQMTEAKTLLGYDFFYEFEQVKPIFEQSDLTVGNLETMVVTEAPYRTEKLVSEQNYHCNAPLEFLDAVRKAGIDMVTNANNHDLDTGAVGIGETIDNIERYGLIQTGTFKSEKKRYELIDVAGFKVAIIAFATEHNNKSCNLTAEGRKFLLCDYSPETAGSIIAEAKAEGAELVFVCIHWGTEHVETQNSNQIKIATELGEMGCDCIIGSHPHVLQPFANVPVGEKTIPVFFSMGNFVSHNSSGAKSRSVIACVDLERTDKGIDLKCSYIPIHTSKDFGDKKYVVLPLPDAPVEKNDRLRREQIGKVMGPEISVTGNVTYSELLEKKPEEKVAPAAAPAAAPKKKKPNITRKENGTVAYRDGSYKYLIGKKSATITGILSGAGASISIPAKVMDMPITAFAPEAFAGNESLKKINFRRTIPVISDGLCRNCEELEGFQLSDKTTRIGAGAFSGCVSLTSAVMRGGVRTIGAGAFRGCVSLRSVKLSAGISEIAEDAFENCPNATFYCEEGTYAHQYVQDHGFKFVLMPLEV